MSKGRVRSATGLNLRDKPNGRVKDVLRADEKVSILEKVSFYRVKTNQGVIGYVHGDFIEEFPEEPQQLTSVASKSFLSATFELVQFSGVNFIGEKVLVDKDFIQALNRIDNYAETSQVKIWVTSSTRNINEQVRGAIVPPASKSCHHIGHAIDMNVQYDGKLFNSKKLKKSNLEQLPKPINNFIQLIRQDSELRWGGDFGKEDPVHIDDDLLHQHETLYLAKLYSRLDQLNV